MNCETVPNVNNDEYKKYLRRGNALKEAEETKTVIEVIGKLGGKNQTFCLLDASSGMGKTQMAFNLIAAGFDVKYLVCSPFKDAVFDQPIYKVFQPQSEAFQQVSKQNNPNYSYGFILSALKRQDYKSEQVNLEEVKKYISENEAILKNVVFFLDEFPEFMESKHDSDNSEYLRRLRNRIRECGLKVLLASTSSSAANLISVSGSSRDNTRDESFVWCYIVPRFPKFVLIDEDMTILNKISNETLRNFFSLLVTSSRPWFSLLTLRFINDINYDHSIKDIINQYIKNMYENVCRAKDKGSIYFLHGQICLVLSATVNYTGKEEENILVHRHFACLADDEPFFPLTIGNTGLIKIYKGFIIIHFKIYNFI